MLWKAGIANYLGVIQYPETGGNEKHTYDGKKTTGTKNKLKLPDVISVYPNPAKESITIKYSCAENKTGKNIKMFSSDGKLIKAIPVNTSSGTLVIDVRSFANGTYHLSLGDKSYSKKIIINH